MMDVMYRLSRKRCSGGDSKAGDLFRLDGVGYSKVVCRRGERIDYRNLPLAVVGYNTKRSMTKGM